MGLRVYPWELGSQQPSADPTEKGECRVQVNGQVYEIWWQKHSEGLVYALVRTEVEAGRALEPGAKTAVAYLVYDLVRQAVVCVHGTALDYGLFVDALERGLTHIAGEGNGV